MAETKWWWNMTEGRAVTSAERPRDSEVLGPYPSKEAAEDWKATSDARNKAWEDEDERWRGDDRGQTGDDPGAGGD